MLLEEHALVNGVHWLPRSSIGRHREWMYRTDMNNLEDIIQEEIMSSPNIYRLKYAIYMLSLISYYRNRPRDHSLHPSLTT
jgi:hypothetical protein